MMTVPKTENVAANCSILHETMECDPGRHSSLFTKPIFAAEELGLKRHICPITIQGHPVEELLDSGSLFTFIYASLMDPAKLGSD